MSPSSSSPVDPATDSHRSSASSKLKPASSIQSTVLLSFVVVQRQILLLLLSIPSTLPFFTRQASKLKPSSSIQSTVSFLVLVVCFFVVPATDSSRASFQAQLEAGLHSSVLSTSLHRSSVNQMNPRSLRFHRHAADPFFSRLPSIVASTDRHGADPFFEPFGTRPIASHATSISHRFSHSHSIGMKPIFLP